MTGHEAQRSRTIDPGHQAQRSWTIDPGHQAQQSRTDGVLRLVLARHGQTQANVDGVLDTVLPGPGLTDLGREQAAALGRDLGAGLEGEVAAVYHSRARRAEETAEIVGAALRLTPQAVDGMHEVQVGDLEGRRDEASIETFRAVFDAWQKGDLEVPQPGGESGHDLLDRYLTGVETIRARHRDGGIVVLVSHGAALRLAAQTLVDRVGTPTGDDNHVGNAGRVIVQTGGTGWDLVAWRGKVPGGLPSSRDDVTG